MTLKEAFKFIAQLVRAGRRNPPKNSIDHSKSASLNPNPSLRLNPNPSFVTTAEDVRSATVVKFRYYPEDLEKMKTMTPQEARSFKAQLVRAGRVYVPDEQSPSCIPAPPVKPTV